MTFFAEEEDKTMGEKAQTRAVDSIVRDHPVYKANVSAGADSSWNVSFIEVKVNVETFESVCPCKHHDEFGHNCHHVKALLLQLGAYGTSENW